MLGNMREYFPRHVPSMSLTFMMSSQIMLAAAPMFSAQSIMGTATMGAAASMI